MKKVSSEGGWDSERGYDDWERDESVWFSSRGMIWKRMLESLVILDLILLSTSEGLINSIVSDSFFMSVPDPLHKSWMLIHLLEEFSKMYLNYVKVMGILTFFTKIGSTDAYCSFIKSDFFVEECLKI